MKPVLTKEEVGKAIAQLVGQAKKPTLTALHAALGHRGSMSTLVRLKAEIDSETKRSADSSEGLEAFRQIWALARAEGRKEQELALAELQESLHALAAENERLQGATAAAQSRAQDLEEARAKAEAELRGLRESAERDLSQATSNIGAAGLQAAKALQDLADARAAYATRFAELQAKLTAAYETAHGFELQLVRARALLEANGVDAGETPSAAS